MNRRDTVLALSALFSWLTYGPSLVRAQTSARTVRRIGVLGPSTHARHEITYKPFFEQMRKLGWVEGRDVSYERFFADDQQEALPRLAQDLVARNPDPIFAPPAPAALAAKRATRTIPIVFALVADPVGIGLVTTLARPGGNATGISSIGASLAPKRFALLREIVPGAKRVGLIGDPTDPSAKLEYEALVSMAASSYLKIFMAEAANPVDFDTAVARLIAERVDAIFTGTSTIAFNLRRRLIELATQNRVPVIATRPQVADDGALFAYGASTEDQLRRSAFLVDKVLKGARPADIPVEQPTVFELVINLKAARTPGIRIPETVRVRADRVIQ